MPEPPAVLAARRHLARAESEFRSEDSLFHLGEGIALLESLATGGEPKYRALTANLLTSYARRICESVKRLVDVDPRLPEPELEHAFKLLLAFDSADVVVPDFVPALKIDIVRRLIGLYYEGHSAERRLEALGWLTELERRDS